MSTYSKKMPSRRKVAIELLKLVEKILDKENVAILEMISDMGCTPLHTEIHLSVGGLTTANVRREYTFSITTEEKVNYDGYTGQL